jgi:1-acyl-sn-glycerol-3-phosphate acyltransferase
VLSVVALTVAPLLLPLALILDLARPRRFTAMRCVLFFPVYLLCEMLGLLVAFVLWIVSAFPGVSAAWILGAHYRLQTTWARALLLAGARIFSWRFDLRIADVSSAAPLLVFVRHASVADTVIPAAILSDRLGLRLRYVLKRELLWDPCLDVVGHRIPNYFANRGSDEPAREIAGVLSLLDGIRPGEGVLIYPEGTRFTASKRARVLERLRSGRDAEALSRAEAFTRVLPPRPGGPIALLEHAPTADALFVAHSGFDAASTFWDFLNGGLVGRTIRVETWRVPASDRPRDRDGLVRWLHAEWLRMDRWVTAQESSSEVAT